MKQGEFATGRTYNGHQIIKWQASFVESDEFCKEYRVRFNDESRSIVGFTTCWFFTSDSLASFEAQILRAYDNGQYTDN